MTTYRALKPHRVRVYLGEAEVKAGELVNFPDDPGEGWEEVGSGSDSRKARRVVVEQRVIDADNEAGV